MESDQIIVFIQCSTIGGMISRSIGSKRHVIFSTVNQFHRGIHFLRDNGCLHNKMSVKAPAKAPTLTGHLDIDLFQRHIQTSGHRLFHRFRSLYRPQQFCLVLRHMRKKVHWLHGVMSQEWRCIRAFNDLGRSTKSTLRIAVLTGNFCQFCPQFLHFTRVVRSVFQTGGLIKVLNRLPVYPQSFFGIHNFPGRCPHDGDEFFKSAHIRPFRLHPFRIRG